MHIAQDPLVVGFVEINLGNTKVRVPVRQSKENTGEPVARFVADASGAGVIWVRDGASERDVESAMSIAARDAAKHFSRKLLN
ncbi:MAG: hypothetical protein IPK82_40155 [Polyangiaceae bacterium]|nr:hypothetical protein [Polyangiaceae bacterium]